MSFIYNNHNTLLVAQWHGLVEFKYRVARKKRPELSHGVMQ